MSDLLVRYEGIVHSVLREVSDWGVRVLDLASPPRRLWGSKPLVPAVVRTNVDPYKTQSYPLPSELLSAELAQGDTWSALSRRSLGRYEAYFLVAEDPQRRLDAREVVTLAHQVSLVRHILDSGVRRRILIGDEVGLGKTVEAGLIVRELLEANPGLRVLYLAPARLVSNVGREFRRLTLNFREWKAQDGDARIESDSRVIASIHRAVHPKNFERLLKLPPWDVIVVDECHHLSDWGEGGGDPVMKYRLVRDLVAAQPAESCLLLLSGTPHQAHSARFDNLLKLLLIKDEPPEAAAGRVIYRTKDDVRDWDGNPLFPRRQVNQPIVIDLDPEHRSWLSAIHAYFKPPRTAGSLAVQRAAGWKCAQALQWAASSPNAGLGYLVRQALRAGWTLDQTVLTEAIAALRPYRSGSAEEPVESVYRRLVAEIRRQASDDDIEDIEEDFEAREELDHDTLASLIRQGIELVRNPRQIKWERLWRDVLVPAAGEKVVLFAQPIETVMALATWLQGKAGTRPAIIMGGQTEAERDREVDRFRQADGPQFLVSSRAGGEGINLQNSRRLVHLDVPWNPMEMEQRVGRVHRFGSRETIQVDTIVVRDSRETHAWAVARERLATVAQTLVAPERFETVFSRVMCLIPPDELQTVLINGPVSPLAESDIKCLSALIDAGFRDWQSFHERYAANQREIREQPAGLAQWLHVRDFLLRVGGAEPVPGISRTRFIRRGDEVSTVDEAAEVLRLGDGSLCFAGNYDGGLFSGQTTAVIGPLGLNIPAVADSLYACINPERPTGAAHLRWGDNQKELRARLGPEVVILALVRQSLRLDSVGGISDIGTELIAYAVRTDGTTELCGEDKCALFEMSRQAVVRVRPEESGLFARASSEEKRLIEELRRPSDEEIRRGTRYAVWPILAAYISP
ncbi:MAG: helicase-related protein [Gammaproteobacteria bacterium]